MCCGFCEPGTGKFDTQACCPMLHDKLQRHWCHGVALVKKLGADTMQSAFTPAEGRHAQECVTSSAAHANSEHASRAPRLHNSVCFRMRKAQLRAALRGVGRGHKPQAVAARTLLADEPDQELAQRQRLGAHGCHGGFQSQVHAHLTTAHPDLNSTQIIMKGSQTLPFELMTLASHLEVATPTDCAVGAGKSFGADDLWWAGCQVRVCVCCMCGDFSETVHAPRGRRSVECRREGLAAPGPCGIPYRGTCQRYSCMRWQTDLPGARPCRLCPVGHFQYVYRWTRFVSQRA